MDSTKGEATKGNSAKGEATKGNSTKAEANKGNSTKGGATKGEATLEEATKEVVAKVEVAKEEAAKVTITERTLLDRLRAWVIGRKEFCILELMDDETNKQMGEEVAKKRVSFLEYCLYACLIVPLKDYQLCSGGLTDQLTGHFLRTKLPS